MPKWVPFANLGLTAIACVCALVAVVQLQDVRGRLAVRERPTNEPAVVNSKAPMSEPAVVDPKAPMSGVWIPDKPDYGGLGAFELFIHPDGAALLRSEGSSGRRPEQFSLEWIAVGKGRFKAALTKESLANLADGEREAASHFEIQFRLHDTDMLWMEIPTQTGKKEMYILKRKK